MPKKRRAFFPTETPTTIVEHNPVESLTLNRIRDSLTAWCRAWRLGWVARKRLVEDAAWQINYTRNHNAAAKTSHPKTKLRKLRKNGIDVEKTRTCIESDFVQ